MHIFLHQTLVFLYPDVGVGFVFLALDSVDAHQVHQFCLAFLDMGLLDMGKYTTVNGSSTLMLQFLYSSSLSKQTLT